MDTIRLPFLECLHQNCSNAYPLFPIRWYPITRKVLPVRIIQSQFTSSNKALTVGNSLEEKIDRILASARKINRKAIKKMPKAKRIKQEHST